MLKNKSENRINIIGAVKTPLGFFTLCVLIMEGGLGSLVFNLKGENQTYALFGMIGCLVFLILVVAIIGLLRPEVLEYKHIEQDLVKKQSHDITESIKEIRGYFENSFSIFRIENYIKMQGDFLKIKELPFESIKAIVLFVAHSPSNKSVEDLLSFRCLEKLSQIETNKTRYVWLLHGDISTDEKSSYNNTGKLSKQFESNNLKIIPRAIGNVNDLKEVFSIVNSIVDHISEYNIERDDIVCDYTAGPKAISIGMTLACLGNLRLAFYPQNNGQSYNEIDTNHLLYSIFVKRRLTKEEN